MEITTGNKSGSKYKSRVGKSGRKRMNKKEAIQVVSGSNASRAFTIETRKKLVVVIIGRGEKNKKRNA